MDTVRVGIVGAGHIARQHLGAMSVVEGITPVGITTRTASKAEALAAEFGCMAVYPTLDAMVHACSLDALMVLVSVEALAPVAGTALEHRLPLFLEKPVGLSTGENRELLLKADRLGVPTMVGFNRRFYSVFDKGLEIVRERGPLLGIAVEGHERLWRVKETGKFTDSVLDRWVFANGVHTVDLLRYFAGEPLSVSSVVRAYKERSTDQMAAVLEFEGGALGSYVAYWHSPGGWSVRLFGDGVSVEYSPLESGVAINASMERVPIEADEEDRIQKPGFVRQIEAFRDLVRTGVLAGPAQGLEGSLRTMELAAAISRSEGPGLDPGIQGLGIPKGEGS